MAVAVTEGVGVSVGRNVGVEVTVMLGLTGVAERDGSTVTLAVNVGEAVGPRVVVLDAMTCGVGVNVGVTVAVSIELVVGVVVGVVLLPTWAKT